MSVEFVELQNRVKVLEDLVQRLTQVFLAPPTTPTPKPTIATVATSNNSNHQTPPKENGAQSAANSLKILPIRELQDGMKRVNVTAKIVEKSDPREVHTANGPSDTATAIITDDSGSIKLVLWGNQISAVNTSDTVTIENGYISNYKGEIQLNIGKWGKLLVNGAVPA